MPWRRQASVTKQSIQISTWEYGEGRGAMWPRGKAATGLTADETRGGRVCKVGWVLGR